MCNCIRRNRQFHLLGLTLPKNWFRFGNSENWCQNKNQHPRYTTCANFQSKWTTLNFLAQFCPKMDLGLEIEKSNVGIRIKILKILSVPIFNQYGELWLFRHKFAQKCILGSEFQKPECEFRISTFKILCVPIFRKNWQLRLFWPNWPNFKNLGSDSESSPPRYDVRQFSVKTDNFEFFGRNLGKLSNYVLYIDSHNVEAVAESWVEAEMSWVEVDGAGWRWMELGEAGWSWMEVRAWFSNTHFLSLLTEIFMK